MTPLSQIPHLKDKDSIDAVQGRISRVFPARSPRGKTVQDAEIQDASGNTIKMSVWEHPDLKPLEGMEVILQSGPRGGVQVKWDDYKKTNVLSVNKSGTFQKLAVHQAQTGGVAAPAQTTNTVPTSNHTSAVPATTVVNGAKVGMALNNATLFMTNATEPFNKDRLFEIASEFVRISNRMEKGELASEVKEDVPY
jgi:hypothetical protein